MKHLSYKEIIEKYRAEDPESQAEAVREELQREIRKSPVKFVVLDDDPTGVQAVHDVAVYTDWSEESLERGFAEKEKLFYILTNSRGMTEEETSRVHEEIARNVDKAARKAGIPYAVISRGDSTLRGHFPLETEILNDTLVKCGRKSADGEIIIPFFKAGGRFTVGNVHYVKYGDELVPAGETEFAGDKTFGYSSSDLREYIEEKTKGKYQAESVTAITLEELKNADIESVYQKLMAAEGFSKIIVNATEPEDLEVFCTALYRAMAAGKDFLFRTAADFVKAVGGISSRPLLKRREMTGGSAVHGGIVVIGSHTAKTTQQLQHLRELKNLEFMEFNSDLVLEDGLEQETESKVARAEALIRQGRSVVIYTKRRLLTLENDTKEAALLRSVRISEAVQQLVGRLSVRPAFVVAKGGITSSDIGVKALGVKRAWVLGQVQPGIPVWKTDEGSKFPGIPYVIFPGNVGEADTLKKVVKELSSSKRKIMISVAPVAGPEPLVPEELAEDVAKCIDLGAGICHLHCKTREGVLTPDITNMAEALDMIRAKRDVVIQVSTGGISDMDIVQRCNPLDYKWAESGSLNGGSTNLGEAVYVNSFDDIRYCAGQCYEKNVIPEIEVFDIGMINNMKLVFEEVPYRTPVWFNLVFGHKGGMQPTIEALAAFRSFVPEGCLWGVTHFGRDNWTFLAAAIAMGASLVRIGFEDSRFLSNDRDAVYNYELVEKLARLVREMDLEVASPDEVREIISSVKKIR